MKAIFPMFKKDAQMMKYFPVKYSAGKGPPREYFFNVLNSVQSDYLHQMMKHANEQRMSATGELGQRESIKISQFWEDQLRSMPYLSRKYNNNHINSDVSRLVTRIGVSRR